MRFLYISGVVLATLLVAFVAFSYHSSALLFDDMRAEYKPVVANPDEALTFARSRTSLILVTDHDEETVSGRDLTAVFGSDADNLQDLFAANRFDALIKADAPDVIVRLEELVVPINYSFPHIAAGTNFRAHADELYVDDPPFLFPKLSQASYWNASVPFVPRLDFEAELCVFPLQDIVSPATEVTFGLVLCNDFTDRWTLVSDVDLSQPLGQTGFAAGKGCKQCLPTGFLVVVPRENNFYHNIKLQLFVNDRLRQRFSMSEMILDVNDIVAQSFATIDLPFEKGNTIVTLMPEGKIPAGTLILTGTGAGVIFKPANIWNQRFYLQPGDVVRTEASFLGFLRNVIKEPAP